MDGEIELKDIDKEKDYAGKRCNIIINEEIKLKNVDIVVHKYKDFVDLYIKRKDQTDKILEKLEKYKTHELPLSTEYLVPIRNLLFQRIIMAH